MSAIRSVLMFCPQFRPIVGGAERQAEKLTRALVRKGLRVKVLTPRLIADTPAYEDDCGVEIHRYPLFDLAKTVPVRGIGPLNLLSMRRQTLRAVGKHLGDAGIVHTLLPSSPVAVFAMQAAHRRGVPFVCTAATSGEKSDLGLLAAGSVLGPILAKDMLKRASFWVALANAGKDTLLECGVPSGKMAMIPNGVEFIASAPRQGPARRFLYLGRLATNIERDVPTLIRAFDRVADKFPEAELAIVGGGDLYGETVALANAARNRARIQLPGTQLPGRWLEWARCFVFPSRYEGLSNALLEAMSWGLACIANDIPANREALGDGQAGILVPIGDEEQMTSAMLRIATDESLSFELGSSALERVKEVYSIDVVADSYIKLYETLCDSFSERSHDAR